MNMSRCSRSKIYPFVITIVIQVRRLGGIAIWFAIPRILSLRSMPYGLQRSTRSSIRFKQKDAVVATTAATNVLSSPFAVPSFDMTNCSPKAIRTVTPQDTPITVCSAVLGEDLTTDDHDSGPFQDLRIPPSEFRPSRTFTTGQCFHWTVISSTASSSAWGTHDATEWIGTLRRGSVTTIVQIRETPQTVLFRTLYASDPALDVRSFLHSYLQLDVCVSDLYAEWSTQCPRLCRIAAALPGVRILDQDPWECLVSFICSSNNNIPRITQMLQSIRQQYGDPIHVPDHGTFYAFPSVLHMSSVSEADLRKKCGMGYRAKYLVATVRQLQQLGGEEYLQSLCSSRDPFWVQEQLQQFTGVGRKVADCVALFSLQQHSAIPVDVHVWNIAKRDYGATTLPTKTLTPSAYRQIGDLFRTRFPSYSGWAHSLLFVAELPSFRTALPPDLLKEMVDFQDQEKAIKAQRKRKVPSDSEE